MYDHLHKSEKDLKLINFNNAYNNIEKWFSLKTLSSCNVILAAKNILFKKDYKENPYSV